MVADITCYARSCLRTYRVWVYRTTTTSRVWEPSFLSADDSETQPRFFSRRADERCGKRKPVVLFSLSTICSSICVLTRGTRAENRTMSDGNRVWETPFLSTHARTTAALFGLIRAADPMIIPLRGFVKGIRTRNRVGTCIADDELTRNSRHCIQREEAIALSVSAPRYSTTQRRCSARNTFVLGI